MSDSAVNIAAERAGARSSFEPGGTMHVDAAELRSAAATIGVQADFAALWISPGLDAAATDLAETSTGAALSGAQAAVQQALTTVSGRYEVIAESLNGAAALIVSTDELAAATLTAIGDLNQPQAG
jgi:hypothetical protein